jgi:putative acetyltransferase
VNIRPAAAADSDPLLAIWLASVRATHHFLADAEIDDLAPLVSEYLSSPGHGLWVLCEGEAPIGFMGVDGASVASLFIAPDKTRRGGGRALMAHARRLAGKPLEVDVNVENSDALAFYLASGFEIVGRSPVDDAGRPYPLFHLREQAASTNLR